MRLVVGEVAELYQQAVLRVELAVPRYQDGREHCVEEQMGEERKMNQHESFKKDNLLFRELNDSLHEVCGTCSAHTSEQKPVELSLA